MKVIIDTNALISCMIGKRLQMLRQHLLNEQVVVLTCDIQLRELTMVAGRTKFRRYFTINDSDDFIDFFVSIAKEIPVATIVDICRDRKDNYLLSLAVDGAADYLVTGDMDLLSLKSIGTTTIMRYTDFELLMETL